MGDPNTFDSDLLHAIRRVVQTGDVVPTLNQGRPNRIGRIDEHGIEVTTDRSLENSGGPRLVPAWMFNHVWNELETHGKVNRDDVDRSSDGPKVKRSSAVFAILERLPEVRVAQQTPLVLVLDGNT